MENFEISVTAVQIYLRDEARVKAIASVVLNNILFIRDLKVCESEGSLFVEFPKTSTGHELVMPMTYKLLDHIESSVIEKFLSEIGEATKSPKREAAIIRVTEHNDGTPADSSILLVDSNERCMNRFDAIKQRLKGLGHELQSNDNAERFFWVEETDRKTSYKLSAI